MSPIQIILILGILSIAYYMHRRVRNTVLDIVLIFLFAISGVFFTIYPETTNQLAKLVGVKRGANLVFYTGFLLLFFLILKLYVRTKKIERSLTEYIRQSAIKEAESPIEE